MSKIVKLSIIEHILLKPNMYFGRFEEIVATKQLFNLDKGSFTNEKVKYSPALVKLFDEALTNATDNVTRCKSHPTTKIVITITDTYIKIWNNGQSISLDEKAEYEGKDYYQPELAFACPYTSSNYEGNDQELNGTNGIGIKLANIFSTRFRVTVVNNKKMFKQIFTKNMSERSQATITDTTVEDCVQIQFEPDFEKLHMSTNCIDEITKEILYKRIFDATLFPVDIILNNKRLPRNSFEQYFNSIFLYTIPEMRYSSTTDRYDLIMFPFKGGHIISSINHTITESGGTHVDYVISKIIELIKKKYNLSLTKAQIKSNICLYLNLNVCGPKFRSQEKNEYIGPVDIKIDYLIEQICSDQMFIDLLQNKKRESEKRKPKNTNRPLFEKLTEANLAGSKESGKCTLFVTEGDSATGMVQQCFSSLGHDYYGIYTLGGKPNNIRNVRADDKLKSVVVKELITSLGIEEGLDYSLPDNFERLRYGKLVCVKDADVDGSAIMMLVCNIIDVIAPSLLKLNNFFFEFITPQIKLIYDIFRDTTVEIFGIKEVLTRGEDGTFVSEFVPDNKLVEGPRKNFVTTFNNKGEFLKFMQFNRDKINVNDVKYYKGLAAISTEDALDYWESYEEYLIPFLYDEDAETIMDKTFSKKQSCVEWRKQLVMHTNEDTYCIRIKSGTDITQYCYFEYGPYAREDCMRVIPALYDGLKPVQRKILYSLLIKAPGSEKFKKVFQIATQASLDGNYHHGDASINEATCKMMQNYTGSNNIPLVAGSGQIGTRFAQGKDHGATRYIEGALSKISKILFPKIDDQLLTRNIEDEVKVEPKHYVPILPMILINGTEGIGVGFSTFVPNHSYEDCYDNVLSILNSITSDETNVVDILNRHELSIRPSYPGFKGEIYYNPVKHCYDTYGKSRFLNINEVEKNPSDPFWKTSRIYSSEHPELNYEHAYLEICEIPISSKVSMNKIIGELKKLMVAKLETAQKAKGRRKQKEDEESKDDGCATIFNQTNISLLVDYQDNSHPGNELQDEKISLILKIKNDGKLSLNSPPEIIKLKSSLSMNNMMLYSLHDNELMLRKFNNIKEIFNEYFIVRYEFYRRRKELLIHLKKEEIKYLQNKINFIKEVAIDKTIKIEKLSNAELKTYLETNNYDMKNGEYKYLYTIPMRSCTKTEYNKLLDELEKKKAELEELINTLIKTFWVRDLGEFKIQQEKLVKELETKRRLRRDKQNSRRGSKK